MESDRKPTATTTESVKHAVGAVPKANRMDPLEKRYGMLPGEPAVKVPSTRRKPIGLRKRFRILRKHGFRCYYCGKSARHAELEIDHILARSRGGTDDEKNLVPACFKCNRGKADGPSVEAEERENCPVALFIEACTVPGREVPTVLYARFVEWVELVKLQPLSQTAFGRRLTELGHVEQRSSGVRYRPLSLRPRERKLALVPPTPLYLKRYYFHGDISESDASLAFCHKCNLFEPRSHFTPEQHAAFSNDTDLERLEWQRVRFRNRPKDRLRDYVRPAGAPNIFEEGDPS
jgi:hypothetical protein